MSTEPNVQREKHVWARRPSSSQRSESAVGSSFEHGGQAPDPEVEDLNEDDERSSHKDAEPLPVDCSRTEIPPTLPGRARVVGHGVGVDVVTLSSDATPDCSGARKRLSVDDMVVGRVFDLGTYEVTTAEIVSFAKQWDPLPIHIDEARAQAGPFHGLIGSGAHQIAIMVRFTALEITTRSTVIAGRGIDRTRFLRPLRPGVVSGRLVVMDVVARERGGSVVTTLTELFDEDGQLLGDMIGSSLWR